MAYPDYPSNIFKALMTGVPTVVAQTTVFALPSRPHRLQSTAMLQTSVDNVTFTDVVASTTGTDSQASYARCTTGTATVIAKSY